MQASSPDVRNVCLQFGMTLPSALKFTRQQATVFISRTVFLRTAGLPARAVEDLQSKELSFTVYEILCLEIVLPALREVARDCLTNELRAQLPAIRQNLLELVRATRQGRVPKRVDVERVAGSSSGQLADAVLHWLTKETLLRDQLKQLSSLVVADLERSRKAMHRWCSRPAFRRALQIANSGFEARLDEYVRSGVLPLHKHRLLDKTLLGYFLRASTKTSPFSSFGLVSRGYVSSGAKDRVLQPIKVENFRSIVRLNAALLWRINHYVEEALTRIGSTVVGINPTSVFKEGRYHFLRTKYTPISPLGAVGAKASQTMFSVRATAVAYGATMVLAGGVQLDLHELCVRIMRDLDISTEACFDELTSLVGAGLLHGEESYDPASYDGAVECIRRNAARVDAPEIKEFFDAVLPEARALEQRDVDTRRIGLRFIESAVLRLGLSIPKLQLHPERSTLLYEDATPELHSVVMGERSQQKLFEHLAVLQRIAPIFDVGAPLRAALVEYFKRHVGVAASCKDLARLAEDFDRECAGALWTSAADGSGFRFTRKNGADLAPNFAAAERLDRIHTLIRRKLRTTVGRSVLPSVDFSLARLNALADASPTRLHAFHSCAYFLQPTSETGTGADWVLNSVFNGSGRMAARYMHLWQEACDPSVSDPTAGMREYLRETYPDGSLLAELPGMGDSNLNFHPATLDHLIVERPLRLSPGVVGIPIEQLELNHDPASDTLRLLWRGRTNVIPVYQGGLTTTLLPSLHRLLLLLGPTLSLNQPSWMSLDPRGADDGPIKTFPRVTSGSLVLMRRAWRLDAAAVPRPLRGEGDGEFFLRMERWRRSAVLPLRGFWTRRPPERQPLGARFSKPQFVDFQSLRCVLAIQGVLTSTVGDIWLTEALPGSSDDGSHLSEFVFDVTFSANPAHDHSSTVA